MIDISITFTAEGDILSFLRFKPHLILPSTRDFYRLRNRKIILRIIRQKFSEKDYIDYFKDPIQKELKKYGIEDPIQTLKIREVTTDRGMFLVIYEVRLTKQKKRSKDIIL